MGCLQPLLGSTAILGKSTGRCEYSYTRWLLCACTQSLSGIVRSQFGASRMSTDIVRFWGEEIDIVLLMIRVLQEGSSFLSRYLLAALCRSTEQDAKSWSCEHRMVLLWHERNEKCPFWKGKEQNQLSWRFLTQQLNPVHENNVERFSTNNCDGYFSRLYHAKNVIG